MQPNRKFQRGFTLVEMIVVIVITGIISGMVAIFIKAPVQGYMDSARRAEMTDIADTALRRIRRDIRTAAPNSVRVPNSAGTNAYIEFLPTKTGGRYRARPPGTGNCGAGAANTLSFNTFDTCFEIIGSPINFTAGDQIVVGSTQSDGNPPYQDPNAAACGTAASTCIRRPVPAAGAGLQPKVVMTSAYAFPAFAELPGQRFDVIPNDQQAVTYSCEGANIVGGEGVGTLRRYWGYGFIPNPANAVPPAFTGQTTAPVSAILADKISSCGIVYDVANQRNGLVAITLGITRGGETISLYHEIHVNNIP